MTKTVSLHVTGMKCGGCEKNIVEKLTALEGVITASADFKENALHVEFDEAKRNIDDIEEVVIAAGFNVE